MKFFIALILSFVSVVASAAENIYIQSPYPAAYVGNGAMYRIMHEANRVQKKYNFLLEFKPGGEQIIAINNLNERPADRLAIIAAKFVDHAESGKLRREDYIPISALGTACFGVISTVGDERKGLASLGAYKDKELVVGGVGIGTAIHLTALELSKKYGFKIKWINFKSNIEAVLLVANNGGVDFTMGTLNEFNNSKARNPNVKLLGMSCPERHISAPQVLTIKEQGIDPFYVFNVTVAHASMPETKRNEIGNILEQATSTVGLRSISETSDFRPPVFDKETPARFLDRNYKHFKAGLVYFKPQIEATR
jgi:tripartite-type tricarboxylate transporter receptor subunit TctC